MQIHNRNGWINTDDEGAARETCQRHPDEWSLLPWIRPSGTPNVNIPDNWSEKSAAVRIDLARQIKGGDQNGETAADLGIANQNIADETIRAYVIGSTHPEIKQ
jgi:hypothetical protein